MTKPYAKTESPFEGRRILVVEDDYWTRFLLHDLLEAHGYLALQAPDVAQALRLVHTHHPDLILTDIRLPGASGVDLLKRIRRDHKLRHIPVVAVTAMAMKQDERMLRARGCAGYLSKPFSSADLIGTVRRCLERAPQNRSESGTRPSNAPPARPSDRSIS